MRPKEIGPWLAALGGAVWCSLYIFPLLNPFRLDIALRSDWAQHTLGWLFFRREALRFPLGSIGDFLYPLGTTLGYMDAIPWIALALRPFSRILPSEFQYLGLWILLCNALLAWVAAHVAALSTKHWEQQALAGVFVTLAPCLFDRIVHPALCAHFFFVLAIGLNLAPSHSRAAAQRTLCGAFALLVVSTATHPYLALMVLALAVGLPYQLRRQLTAARVFAAWLIMVGLVACVLSLFGYVGRDMQVATGGFGSFSANLNTFINSMGHSRLFPGLPTAYLQYEGYCYLGAGCFLLCAVVAGLLLSKRTRPRILSFPWRRMLWPLLAAGALAVFALATPWRWGARDLLHVRLYHYIEWVAQVFRSTGRFIWPLAYVINIALVTAVLRALRLQRWAATGTLLTAVALQAYDIDTTQAEPLFARQNIEMYAAPAWSLADQTFKHLVLFPAEIEEACESPDGYRGDEVNALAYLAYRRGWTFNSGYSARVHRTTADYCRELKRQIQAGELQPNTIYVTERRDVQLFRKARASCGRLNGVYVCVVPREHPFAAYLAKHKR